MDSSTSGSFQSSTGPAAGATANAADNEEYDSRTPPISSFFTPSNLNHLLHPPPPPPPSSSSHHHHPPPPSDTTSFFNPTWPTGTTLPDFTTYPINHPLLTNPTPKSGHGSGHNPIGVTVKNPKKRTRASRRAPTTVLTTDTTNFRQMVQEFTGIPTSPFTTTATPLSRRLDLFRPTAEKLQQPPPFLNPVANIVESSSANHITAASSSTTYNLHPSTIRELQKQPSSLLELQNSMLSFQSLLQTSIPQHANRWRGQNEKLDSGLENDGDQVQGNEGSWICPSN